MPSSHIPMNLSFSLTFSKDIIIIPSEVGAQERGKSYDENSWTYIQAEKEADAIHLLEIIISNASFSDRIRSLAVDFKRDTPFTRKFGDMLKSALRNVPKLESLTLEGCLEYEYGLLESPTHFPCLRNLTCDFPPTPKFVDFLRKNPTIEVFSHSGADVAGIIFSHSRLPRGVLPNLQYMQCDLWMLSYFVPGRPVFWVMPLNYPILHRTTIDPESIDQEIQALGYSTAGGGKSFGGGVRKLWLGCSYPLPRLFQAVPNLEHLHIEEQSECFSNWFCSQEDPLLDNDFKSQFWATAHWEDGLSSFERLRTITVRSLGEIAHDEQRMLVCRWSASSHEPKILTRINFECGFSHSKPEQQGLVDRASPPVLARDRLEHNTDQGTDETLGLDDKVGWGEVFLSDGDRESLSGYESDDDSAFSANVSRSKWIWEQSTGRWDYIFEK